MGNPESTSPNRTYGSQRRHREAAKHVLDLGGKIRGMTLARTERSENSSAALKTMLDGIGDAPLDEVAFAPSAHPDILNTTWDERTCAAYLTKK
jgi:hypothetical protein